MTKVKLKTLDDVELFAKKGLTEIELSIKVEGEEKEITVNSVDFENDLGEFMFNDLMSSQFKELAEKVLKEVSADSEQVGPFKKYTLKEEYKQLLTLL